MHPQLRRCCFPMEVWHMLAAARFRSPTRVVGATLQNAVEEEIELAPSSQSRNRRSDRPEYVPCIPLIQDGPKLLLIWPPPVPSSRHAPNRQAAQTQSHRNPSHPPPHRPFSTRHPRILARVQTCGSRVVFKRLQLPMWHKGSYAGMLRRRGP